MKILHIPFLMFLFVGNLIGQIPDGTKYDLLEYSFDSSSVLITKGKTISIYNVKANSLYVVPKKNYLINFPQSNVYAEIPVKGGDMWIHFLTANGNYSFSGSDSVCQLRASNPLNYSFVEDNGRPFDLVEGSYVDSVPDNIFEWGQYKIQRQPDGNDIITSYSGYLEFLDMSDVTHIVPGCNGSGVYSFKSKTWKIEPKYKTIFKDSEFAFCLDESLYNPTFVNGNEPREPEFNYVYDLFIFSGEREVNLTLSSFTELDEDLIAKILNADEIHKTGEYGIYYTIKNGLYGLAQFSLFTSALNEYPHFIKNQLVKPVADYIVWQPETDMLVAAYLDSTHAAILYSVNQVDFSLTEIASDSERIRYIFDPRDPWNEHIIEGGDSSLVMLCDDDNIKLEPTDRDRSGAFPSVGIQILNDSLLIISDVVANELENLKSQLYWGEDSLSESGEAVYTISNRGRECSGVYNLNTGAWVVPPQYLKVIPVNSGFLLTSSVDPEAINNYGELNYFAVDTYNEPIFSFKTVEEIYADPTLLKRVVPFSNVDSCFAAPTGFENHRKVATETKLFYVKSGGKYGIYSPNESFENVASNELFEFVHYNPSLNFYFYLDGDSIRLNSEFGKMAVSRSGKIIYSQVSIYNDPLADYFISVIDQGDTSFYGDIAGYPQSLTTASVEMKNDVLVVNDCTRDAGWMCESCMDEHGQYYTQLIRYDSENSSVWKKVNGSWRKVSPYYASIESIKTNKYIASSGNYYQYYDSDYDLETIGISLTEQTVEGRYFLLDSNLNAIPYMDYFDFADIQDLGFGLKVKLNGGDKYFFMTYNLQAVTNAEWDNFEIEKGKLRAIINTTYLLDSDGNLVLDEFGNPIEEISQTVKYFKMP